MLVDIIPQGHFQDKLVLRPHPLIRLLLVYRIRVKFGGDKKLTVWRSDLEPPIIMSANYFNLGGGADHSSWYSSLNRCQELLTIDGDSPWEVLQAGGIGGGVTETQCLWTANNNVRQLDIRQTKLPPNIALIRYICGARIRRLGSVHIQLSP